MASIKAAQPKKPSLRVLRVQLRKQPQHLPPALYQPRYVSTEVPGREG